MKPKPNLKLNLTLSTFNQSFKYKKALIIPLISAGVIIACAQYSYAMQLEPVEYKTSQVVQDLRKYYRSPVKSLNRVIKKTSSTPQEIPIFSLAKNNSFVTQKFSEKKEVPKLKEKDDTIFEWIANGAYSKFINDPSYAKNVKFGSTPLASEDFKYDNIDTSVVTLRINNKIAYDFEVIIWPDGSTSVPIKTLAELVDIAPEQNHVNNNITFINPTTDEKITIDYKNNTILVDSNLIEIRKPKLVFIKEGFIVQNDIFIPQKIAEDILDIRTNFSKESYAFDLGTSRTLKALVEINENQSPNSFVIEEKYNEVSKAEKENLFFKIKKLTYSLGSSMSASSGMQSSSNSAAQGAFNLNGNFLGGEFNIGSSTSYGQSGMYVSGYRASLDYIKPKYELSLGATNARLSDLAAPGASIWGVRFNTVGANDGSSSVPRLIEGQASNDTYVELYINGVYAERANVVNGRYEFDSLKHNTDEPMVRIVVESIDANGKRDKVYDRKFSQDRDLLAPGQKQFVAFSGVDSSAISQQYQLFGDQFNNAYIQPVKFVSGVRYRMGITDNLTAGVSVAKDFIIRQPSKLLLSNTRKLSSARSYRTGRSSSGSVVSMDFDYVASKNLRINSEVGYSIAESKVDPFFDPDGTDFGGYIGFNYNKKNFGLNGKVFSYGPDFYSAGSSGLMDKRGFELSSNLQIDKVNLSGTMTKYQSNLDDYFDGGISTVTDYSLYASGNIDQNSTIRAGVRSTGAENSFYYDRDTTYDITLSRRLSDKANLNINYAKTIREAKATNTSAITRSSNNLINADISYNAGKVGIIRLAHEMMSLDPVDRLLFGEIDENFLTQPVYSKNIRLSLDRSSLPIKGITFSPNVGYRYGGDNKGLNFGASLGYMFKSGKQIALNYAYNSSFGKYMAGAFNFGGTKSHTLSLNFSDTVGFGVPKTSAFNNSYKSAFDNTGGIIKGKVFVDLNQNGIQDEGEEGLSAIDINFKNMFNVTTDSKGNYIASVGEGLHKVGLDKETLPVIYTPTTPDALVKVQRQKVYVANLGVIVTPGSISGRVENLKEGSSNSEVVILLVDKNGREVKYTTTDSTGGFYIGSIAPGSYKVIVDKNYLDYKGLQMDRSEGLTIDIPLVIDDFVDLENINFKLIAKQGEVKKF